MQNLLKDGYVNDGFIYCIDPYININGKKIVKIGKIAMKINDTYDSVLKRLSSRYNTYYPNKEIIYFERVNNCHKAERYLFSLIDSLKYKRELFYYDNIKIKCAFNKMNKIYPDMKLIIKKLSVKTLTKINIELRENKN